MSDVQLFIVEEYANGRWVWTKNSVTHGPVQRRAIKKAFQRAQCGFPKAEFRIKEVGRLA